MQIFTPAQAAQALSLKQMTAFSKLTDKQLYVQEQESHTVAMMGDNEVLAVLQFGDSTGQKVEPFVKGLANKPDSPCGSSRKVEDATWGDIAQQNFINFPILS